MNPLKQLLTDSYEFRSVFDCVNIPSNITYDSFMNWVDRVDKLLLRKDGKWLSNFKDFNSTVKNFNPFLSTDVTVESAILPFKAVNYGSCGHIFEYDKKEKEELDSKLRHSGFLKYCMQSFLYGNCGNCYHNELIPSTFLNIEANNDNQCDLIKRKFVGLCVHVYRENYQSNVFRQGYMIMLPLFIIFMLYTQDLSDISAGSAMKQNAMLYMKNLCSRISIKFETISMRMWNIYQHIYYLMQVIRINTFDEEFFTINKELIDDEDKHYRSIHTYYHTMMKLKAIKLMSPMIYKSGIRSVSWTLSALIRKLPLDIKKYIAEFYVPPEMISFQLTICNIHIGILENGRTFTVAKYMNDFCGMYSPAFVFKESYSSFMSFGVRDCEPLLSFLYYTGALCFLTSTLNQNEKIHLDITASESTLNIFDITNMDIIYTFCFLLNNHPMNNGRYVFDYQWYRLHLHIYLQRTIIESLLGKRGVPSTIKLKAYVARAVFHMDSSRTIQDWEDVDDALEFLKWNHIYFNHSCLIAFCPIILLDETKPMIRNPYSYR